MTPKEKAKEIFLKFALYIRAGYMFDEEADEDAKKCALIAVDEIILSNPHSNPFNTDVYSTMGYWQEVKQEIEKL
jgi:hypothetical protein